jgi:hypothetical protein
MAADCYHYRCSDFAGFVDGPNLRDFWNSIVVFDLGMQGRSQI